MCYNTENNINFYNELNKILKSEKSDTEQKTCLLSMKPLIENYITLACRHTFNYDPLYQELLNQKTKSSHLEIKTLEVYQTKCPYCRHITNKILPYIDGYNRVRGVNFPEKYSMSLYTCEWVFKSGAQKNKLCSKSAVISDHGVLCNAHLQLQKRKKEKKVEEVDGCTTILKTGKRKGKECGKKVFKDLSCKFHLKFKKNTD